MYVVTIKCYNRHFKGDESYSIQTLKVQDEYIDNWMLDDFHCKTLSAIKTS